MTVLPPLDEVLSAARASRRLAVDTEFVRERTYFPELALIQVGARDPVTRDVISTVIDPLAPGVSSRFEAVAELLLSDDIVKVFHSGGQDLEVLRYTLGIVPRPIFDTQIAAAEVGLGRQLSYAATVELLLGLPLEKGNQRADWLRRPLSPELLAYARGDVEHLVPVAEALEGRVRDADREEAVFGRCARLVAEATQDETASELAERVKGATRLTGPARRRIEALAAWREAQARAHDVPRRWFAPDEALLAIAKAGPTSLISLSDLRDVPATLRSKHGQTMLDVIRG